MKILYVHTKKTPPLVGLVLKCTALPIFLMLQKRQYLTKKNFLKCRLSSTNKKNHPLVSVMVGALAKYLLPFKVSLQS